MFWSKNKKKVYPCKPQFYYIKVGCKGVLVTRTCFRDVPRYKGVIPNLLTYGLYFQILCFLLFFPTSLKISLNVKEKESFQNPK